MACSTCGGGKSFSTRPAPLAIPGAPPTPQSNQTTSIGPAVSTIKAVPVPVFVRPKQSP